MEKCNHPRERRRSAGHRESVIFCTYCGSIGQWNGWDEPILWIAPELTRSQVNHPVEKSRIYEPSDTYPDITKVLVSDWREVLGGCKKRSRERRVLNLIRRNRQKNKMTFVEEAARLLGSRRKLQELIAALNQTLPSRFQMEMGKDKFDCIELVVVSH